MTTKYEFLQGIKVHPDWRDREAVPVPPQKIRAKLKIPARYTMATLASAVEDTYRPSYYNGALEFLKNWPAYQDRGMGPIFVGKAGMGTSWVAAALANEITMRSEGVQDITVNWLSGFWMLQVILDHREWKSEGYHTLRNAMFKNDLIIVDDLLSAEHIPGGVAFMHTVYASRYDNGLSTITTITSSTSDYMGEVKRVYGKNFVERLQATSNGLIFT